MFLHQLEKKLIDKNIKKRKWVKSCLMNYIKRIVSTISGLSVKQLAIWFTMTFMLSTILVIPYSLYFLKGKQIYDDIIVGSITWNDIYKTSDYLIIGTFLFLFFTIIILILAVYSFRNKRNSESLYDVQITSSSTSYSFKYVLMTGIIYLILYWVLTGILPKFESMFLLIGLSGYLFMEDRAYKSQTKYSYFSEKLNPKVSMLVFFLIFLYFTAISAVALAKFLNPFIFIDDINVAKKIVYLISSIGILVSIFVGVHLEKVSINTLSKWLKCIQIPLPLLLLVLLNDTYQTNQRIIHNNIGKGLKVVVCTVIVICILLLSKSVLSHNKRINDTGLNSSIFTTSIVSITAFLSYRTPVYSSLVSDDFHLGELILPWQQIIQYHQTMFEEFVSIQGIMGLLYGGVNNLLYEGTISSFPMVFTLLPVLIAMITGFFACKTLGNKWGLLVSILALPFNDRFYLLIVTMLILFNKKLMDKCYCWISLWMWLSIVNFLYNPTVGAAQIISTLPIAGYIFSKIIKNRNMYTRAKVLIITIVQISFLVPIFPLLIQQIVFLLDNSSSNTTAFGIGTTQVLGMPDWLPKRFNVPLLDKIWWESIRVGPWVICLIFFAYLLLKNQKYKITESYTRLNLLLVSSILLIVSLIPYSMGRIDPGSLSRPGTLSLIALCGLLPIIIIIAKKRIYKVSFSLCLGIALAYKVIFGGINFFELPLKAIETIKVPSDALLVNGRDIGMPNIGIGYVLPDRLNELTNLKLTMDKLLKDGETYADLTNRSAFYFYLDKKVPSLYSADYVAANSKIQKKVINSIKKNSIPVVLIGPSIRHDGGPASIRAYRIYRWFIEKDYRYYESNGFQFLVRNDRFNDLSLSAKGGTTKLEQVFHIKDLASIPIAWGRNISRLEKRFKTIEEINMKDTVVTSLNDVSVLDNNWIMTTGKDPYLTWTLRSKSNGVQSDFILLKIIADNPKAIFTGQIFWGVDGEYYEEKSFTFNAVSGELLIPIGSSPDWLRGSNNSLRLDIDGVDKFKVDSIKLLRLID